MRSSSLSLRLRRSILCFFVIGILVMFSVDVCRSYFRSVVPLSLVSDPDPSFRNVPWDGSLSLSMRRVWWWNIIWDHAVSAYLYWPSLSKPLKCTQQSSNTRLGDMSISCNHSDYLSTSMAYPTKNFLSLMKRSLPILSPLYSTSDALYPKQATLNNLVTLCTLPVHDKHYSSSFSGSLPPAYKDMFTRSSVSETSDCSCMFNCSCAQQMNGPTTCCKNSLQW